jgi:hypothetical protein
LEFHVQHRDGDRTSFGYADWTLHRLGNQEVFDKTGSD